MNRTSYRVIRPYQNNLKMVAMTQRSRTNTSLRNPLHLRRWNPEWEEQAFGYYEKSEESMMEDMLYHKCFGAIRIFNF